MVGLPEDNCKYSFRHVLSTFVKLQHPYPTGVLHHWLWTSSSWFPVYVVITVPWSQHHWDSNGILAWKCRRRHTLYIDNAPHVMKLCKWDLYLVTESRSHSRIRELHIMARDVIHFQYQVPGITHRCRRSGLRATWSVKARYRLRSLFV